MQFLTKLAVQCVLWPAAVEDASGVIFLDENNTLYPELSLEDRKHFNSTTAMLVKIGSDVWDRNGSRTAYSMAVRCETLPAMFTSTPPEESSLQA